MVTTADDATVVASAPGSMMLLGEHAVLAGKRALVAAVAPRVHVRLLARKDNRIVVTSPVAQCDTSRQALHFPNTLRFVGCALQQHAQQFPTGFKLQIDSDLPHTQGLGSSAAVTVATVGAVRHWLHLPTHASHMLHECVAAMRQAQHGVGSGADVAASIAGGMLLFCNTPGPRIVCRFNHLPPIVVLYCGYKTPTPQVIQHVQQLQAQNPLRHKRLYSAMDELASQAVPVCTQQQWPQLGQLLHRGHQLLAELGVSTPLLDNMAHALCQQPNIWGAKISGAGLGDCVLAVGSSSKTDWPWQQVHTHITSQGFRVQSLFCQGRQST